MRPIVPTVALLCCFMLASFTGSSQPGNGNSSDRMFLRAKLYNAAGYILDGNAVAFDDDFSNGYDRDDAVKMMNPGENLGMRRDGRTLAIEARNVVTANDTIYYDLRNLSIQTYEIKFAAKYMHTVGLVAVLKDNFTGIQTPVSLTDSTFFFFTVTANPASKAFDRLTLSFLSPMAAAVLPVKFVSTTVKRNSGSNSISWVVAEEMHITHYNVERSTDGRSFKTVGRVAAGGNASGSAAYDYTDVLTDASLVFYRITGQDKDGRHNYSKIVQTDAAIAAASLSSWPNPLTGPQLQVKISGVAQGNYQLALTSMLGQKVYSSTQRIIQGTGLLSISLPAQVVNGQYLLSLTGEDGSKLQQQLIIKR
ncbi:MAG: T9SS type A sorting domain-containing protein [Sphingobacteriales bacterium]|nr:MAG: T9SS type A sorting domain-containing protein [Sphingobacteriales bacterium]